MAVPYGRDDDAVLSSGARLQDIAVQRMQETFGAPARRRIALGDTLRSARSRAPPGARAPGQTRHEETDMGYKVDTSLQEAVTFTADDLTVAIDQEIEVRG